MPRENCRAHLSACIKYSWAGVARALPPPRAPDNPVILKNTRGKIENTPTMKIPFTIPMLSLTFCAAMVCTEGSLAAQSSLNQAQVLISKGALNEGVAMLRRIAEKNPNDARAHLMLGKALAVEGARSESIDQMMEAIRLSPNSATAHNELGMVLSRFLESGRAREAFEKALELDPQFTDAHVNLALILAQNGEFEAAHQHLDRAIELKSSVATSARAYYVRAMVWSEQEDNQKAIRDLEKATQLNPAYFEAWLDLAQLRYSGSDSAGALTAAKKAVEINPQSPAAQYQLGRFYMASGNTAEALKHLKTAVSLGSDDKATLYALTRALRAAGRLDEAQAVDKQVIELGRRSLNASEVSLTASGLNGEGIRLEKTGDIQAALAKYKEALDLDPTGYGFRLNYALALCRLARWDDGVIQLREVLKEDPDNADAAKALYIAEEQAAKVKR